MQPSITIITVVYNGEKHLEQTIKSVINQSYDNLEYLIIDGGSTDGTIAIIKKYEPFITKWVSEPDQGLYDAMNKGISMAKGELVGMINSDDWYEPNALYTIVEAYRQNPNKRIFHANRYDINEHQIRKVRKFNPSSFKFKYYGMTYNHPSMFVSSKEYASHVYNISLRSLSDYQFVLTSYLKDSGTFHYIDEPIVNYRLGGISSNLSVFQSRKEGFRARRLAGMSILECWFYLVFATVIHAGGTLLNLVKKMKP